MSLHGKARRPAQSRRKADIDGIYDLRDSRISFAEPLQDRRGSFPPGLRYRLPRGPMPPEPKWLSTS